ncbi:hypothetical protein [Enterovirga sp.]|uniref:hypothetical protein n=1 Tax=Enterovirga sp. TaxID=2026350 RepID=UPI002D0D26A0|nr:hypothetical protein [Enterovirga sp.]HMO28598.1 hypothetical protein [Enterovirga sp.]
MSASPSKHVINNAKLESALIDVQGDVLLLDLAIEDMGMGDAWGIMSRVPLDGYKLFLLTNEQVRAIRHAICRLRGSIDEAAIEFWGRELAFNA